MRIDILGVGFDPVTLEQAADRGFALANSGGFHYVVTPNPELVEMARQQEDYRAILNGADLVLPDGIGVIYSAKILGKPLTTRVPGIDFASALMEKMAQSGQRLFLLGAKPGVADLAAERLRTAYPTLTICGTCDGYFQEDEPVIAAIAAARAHVVFVCLGAPKQEQWIATHGVKTGASLMVGLGGALDVFAGQVQRAPEAWQRLGLEWLYRLKQEPSRVGRMAKLPLFLVKALGARLGIK